MAALNSLPVISKKEPKIEAPVVKPRSVFPADCQTFGEQLTAMGYEKLIVLKAIQLFGKDEDKCIGTIKVYFNTFTSYFKTFFLLNLNYSQKMKLQTVLK